MSLFRFDSQVDWKICVECFCVCVPFLSKCIHSSCVEDHKEPKRLFFVGVSRMAKSCWSCVKQNAKKLPLIYEVSCENTHVRSHFSKCRMKCTLACIVCTDKSIKCTLQTRAGERHCACASLWLCVRGQCNYVLLPSRALSASSLQFFSQTRRSNLRARSFISIYLYLYFACWVWLQLQAYNFWRWLILLWCWLTDWERVKGFVRCNCVYFICTNETNISMHCDDDW